MPTNKLSAELELKLVDDVSKPARTVAQALTDIEKSEKAVAKALAGTNIRDPFQKQLAGLKVTASELETVNKKWRQFAVSQKLSRSPNYWTKADLAGIKEWERGVLSSFKAVRKEQTAYGRAMAMAKAGAMGGGRMGWGGHFGAMGGKASDFASWALPGSMGMALGIGGGAAISGLAVGGAATYGIKQAVDFNKAMAEVKKKVNLDAGASYADVEAMINASARRLGIAREEVAGLVAQAGQAGVEFKDLAGFMDLTTKGAVAFDMPARDMAQRLAQLKASASMSNAELSDIVDIVNTLGDKSASSERDIVEMLGRTGAAAKAAGVPLKTTLAMTTAANSVGMEPETASRFFTAMTTKLRIAENLPKKAQEGFKELGLTAKDVANGMQRDATGTILNFFDRLNKSANSSSILVKIVGEQWQDETQRLGQAIGEVTKNLEIVNDPSKWKGSADKALSLQLETTANHLERIKALASEVGDSFARWVLPDINKSIDSTIRTVEDWMHPKKSTGPGSIANYEAVHGLGEQPKGPPPASWLGYKTTFPARAIKKAGPSWAQSPEAGPMGVPGGISANYLPAFQRMHLGSRTKGPVLDFNSIDTGATKIDLVGTALQKLNTTVSPQIQLNTNGAEEKINGVQSQLQSVDGKTATAVVDVNTAGAEAKIAHLKSEIASINGMLGSASSAAAGVSAQASRAAAAVGSAAAAARSNYVAPSVPQRT